MNFERLSYEIDWVLGLLRGRKKVLFCRLFAAALLGCCSALRCNAAALLRLQFFKSVLFLRLIFDDCFLLAPLAFEKRRVLRTHPRRFCRGGLSVVETTVLGLVVTFRPLYFKN